jgi:hypothetical protein
VIRSLPHAFRVSSILRLPMATPIDDYQHEPLVSLEEALHPLIGAIPDVVRYVQIAKYNFHDRGDGLTQDESASIFIFTMEWEPDETCLYRVLNETLRSEDRNKLKPWFPYLKLFLTALYKLPSFEGLVWRNVKVDVSENYQQGHTGTWWGVTSTTTNSEIFESDNIADKHGKRTLFLIECKHGKCIKSHSMFRKEMEIILMPGFHFEILNKLDLGDGSFMVNIKEK